MRKTRWRALPWALWTGIRASWLYTEGKITEDEWRTRIGIARVAAGTGEINLKEEP